MIRVTIPGAPARTTAQQKGVRGQIVGGKWRPRFYTKASVATEAERWAPTLARSRPQTPLSGPLTLFVRFVYPYPQSWSKKKRGGLFPKLTKPDCTNAVKKLEDQLVQHGFVVDDALFARVTIEKWHGPDSEIGITIEITEGVA